MKRITHTNIQKKAQSELLGFVIVVLIISVGLLFVVGFMVMNAKNASTRTAFTDKQLAVNLNKALLQTTSECDGKQVKDLIVDCADRKAILCQMPNGQRAFSCEYLEYQIPKLLSLTLDEWGAVYEYKIVLESGQDDITLYQKPLNATELRACRQAKVTPGTFPIPLRTGQQVYSILRICSI
jgi:competence protein ComGC